MLQGDDWSPWGAAQGPWPTGGLLGRAGLGADGHVRRASRILERAEPAQWRAAAARAFVARLTDLVGAIHLLSADIQDAEDRVAELEVELEAARAALASRSPWWPAR
jgi:hypothetical protein